MAFTLDELAQHVNGKVAGDKSHEIHAVAALDKADKGDISFITSSKYRKTLQNTRASAVILNEQNLEACPVNAIIVEDPHVAYAKIASLLYPYIEKRQGIHPSAVIADDCDIHESAWIGANAVIKEGVILGPEVQIGEGSVIEVGVTIGDGTLLHPNVTIYHDCRIGKRNIIHSGTVIGSDGFGNANENGHWLKIPQLGRVIIGDDVEIGANTAIDRGALEDTVIEDGVRLDNLIHIAHNVRIGAHTAIAASVGIAGSTTIGKHCMIGGQVGISGHLEITDNVMLTGRAAVLQSIKEPGVYSSCAPLDETGNWRRTNVRIKQLDEMARRLKAVEKALEKNTAKG